MDLKSVITIDPDIQYGTPVFTGSRVPVEAFFDHLEAGLSIDDFLQDFPTVQKDQALALLEAANRLLTSKNLEDLYAHIAG